MRIAIGNDHGGYELKKQVTLWLRELRHEVHDCGCHSIEIVRYPYYASLVASAVTDGTAERGILICSTGIGISIAANKYRGIRAALCTDSYMAHMTRAHNDSNILCLGGMCTSTNTALNIVDVWLKTQYEGGRHDISLRLIKESEIAMVSKAAWRPEIPTVQ